MNEAKGLGGKQKLGKGRQTLLILAVVFLLPFTMAVMLHFLDIRPGGKSFGNLITPPISLKFPLLQTTQGKNFTLENWDKKWSIVVIADNGCQAECQATLDKLNRVHISLAKEFDRVQRILLLPNVNQNDATQEIQNLFLDLNILMGEDKTTKQFVSNFKAGSTQTSSIYLVDPLNNLMMQYPQDVSPKDLRSDLVKLLKNSWGG